MVHVLLFFLLFFFFSSLSQCAWTVSCTQICTSNPRPPTPTYIIPPVTLITKTGGPYSQLLRVKRICAKNTDFERYAHKTMGHYKLRGYPESVVQSAWNKTKSVTRTTLLTIREEDDLPEEAPLVCITQYHRQNPPIQDILKKNLPTLEIDPKLNTISDKGVVFGHKRGKNLWDILVQSKLSYPPTVPNPMATVINPTKVCNNSNCRYCPKLNIAKPICFVPVQSHMTKLYGYDRNDDGIMLNKRGLNPHRI